VAIAVESLVLVINLIPLLYTEYKQRNANLVKKFDPSNPTLSCFKIFLRFHLHSYVQAVQKFSKHEDKLMKSNLMTSTSLVAAVNDNNLELAKKLIASGSDVNQTDSHGNSLLIVSAANGNSEMVRLLLNSGADIRAVDSSMKGTALHAAAYLEHPEVMKILIEYGIALNAQGPYNGYSALHDAVVQNNVEGVKLLVNAGAQLNTRSKYGDTPLELAMKCMRREIVTILA